MSSNVSVLIVNKSIDAVGVLVNASFVLGLTAGRHLPDETFGDDVVDGDDSVHRYLTRIGHFVRKATASKIRTLRGTFVGMPEVALVDYTDDAAPADYEAYEAALRSHGGEEINYRAIHVYGPSESIVPLTKNLSSL